MKVTSETIHIALQSEAVLRYIPAYEPEHDRVTYTVELTFPAGTKAMFMPVKADRPKVFTSFKALMNFHRQYCPNVTSVHIEALSFKLSLGETNAE